ncbi:hypothetical protein JCM3775_005672 [Rhodotorula graminis]
MVGAPNGARRESMLPAAGQQASTMAVKVVVRIRPSTTADGAANLPARFQRIAVHPLGTSSLQADNPAPGAGGSVNTAAAGAGKAAKQTFTYDRVVAPDEGQLAVYEAAQPLVASFLDGYNTTLLAYGMSSSGKSYTMGTDIDGASTDPDRQGLTPRAVADIFDRLSALQRDSRGGFSFDAKVSYLEIYNEDLIDLLAGGADVRPTVQIREDKGGQILLQGIREVKVSSAAHVMDLLAQGSTLRQTGATDMNAQSSRSHAIFSLTVTRRKWTGPGPPPSAPSTPSSPQNRRMSALPRMSSPAPPGRAGTPTGDRPASRFGLRPTSSLGRPSTPSTASSDDVEGSWTVTTSKLHFVDLAGSERLKRTAAAGDRAKEGISINAGLSALGNVISALGDPSKKATHVPYRDSKLTRFLQDSLGGNARTMMVACVSPVELNLAETLNTLRYANRARNIKNRAEVNEVEQGWDDVEYLQRTIVKLRGELSAIKAGDGAALARRSLDLSSAPAEAELQQKIAHLTAELAVAQAAAPSSPTTPTATAPLSRDQFAAAVEPIVEEYERSLSALESQLALTRAALGHSDEEMRELEARIGEEQHANEANLALVDELRLRVAKLSEREETTEAYVRDLEARLRDVDDADESHGAAVGALRKELARNREQAAATELHVQELEGRLASAEEGNAALRRQIEILERDVAHREESHRDLEARVQLLDSSADSKKLLAEIDDKDRRLLDLERELDAVKVQAGTATDEASRLHKLAQDEKALKEELESRVRTLENGQARNLVATPPRTPAMRSSDASSLAPPDLDAVAAAASATDEQAAVVDALRKQVAQLQHARDETTSELDSAKAKYAESLREIDDLNAQVQEARLLRSQASASDLSDAGLSPSSSRFAGPRRVGGQDDDEDEDEVEELASSSVVGGKNGSSAARRATGPRTPHARRSMPLSPQHRLSFLGRGQGAVSPAHLRSASLSQELSSAASSQISCPTIPQPVSPSPSSHSRRESFFAPSSTSSTSNGVGDRSYEQMKSEVLKLQAALDQRDAEISDLEATVQHFRSPFASSAPSPSGDRSFPSFPVITERPATPPPLPASSDADLLLSPHTRSHFDALRASVGGADPATVGLGLSTAPDDAALTASRLDDLMRSMAQKESAHRDAVDVLEGELAQLRRQHDELVVLSKTQVENMSAEIEQLRRELDERPARGALEVEMEKLRDDARVKADELAAARTAHEDELGQVKAALMDGAAEHQRALESTLGDHSATIDSLRADHAAALGSLRVEHVVALERAVLDRDEAVRSSLGEASSVEHDRLRSELAVTLKERGSAHAAEVAALRASHEAVLEQVAAGAAESAERERAQVVAAHAADLDALRSSLASSSAAELDRLRTEHSSALQQRALAHAAGLDELRNSLGESASAALDGVRAEHAAALDTRAAVHADELAALRTTHGAALAAASENALEVTERARVELVAAHVAEIEALRTSHVHELAARASGGAEEVELALSSLAARHDGALEALKREHAEALERARSETAEQAQAELDAVKSRHEQELSAVRAGLGDEREQAMSALKEEHEKALADLQQLHASTTDDLRSTLSAEHASLLASTQQEHADAFDLLRREHGTSLEQRQAEHVAAFSALEHLHADKLEKAVQDERARLVVEHEQASEALKAQHAEAVEQVQAAAASERAALQARHAQEVEAAESAAASLRVEHDRAVDAAQQSHVADLDELKAALSSEHASAVERLGGEHAAALDALRDEHVRAVASLRDEHARAIDSLHVEHAGVVDQASTRDQDAVVALEVDRDALKQAHEELEVALSATRDELVSAKESLSIVVAERDGLSQRLDKLAAQHANFVADHAKEVNSLRQTLKVQQHAPSTSASSSGDLQEALAALSSVEQAHDEDERHAAVEQARAAASRLDTALAQARQERDGLSTKLARMSLSSASAAPLGLGLRAQSPPVGPAAPPVDAFSALSSRAKSPTGELDRATSPPLRNERFLSNGSTFSLKAPPPTPPPTVPPPPAPHPTAPLPPLPQESPSRTVGRRASNSSVTASTSPEQRRGSLGPDPSAAAAQAHAQATLDAARALKEQHERLKQRLAQRDAEYQSQVDLVNTLESALNDSERNLRKARLQSNEYARERDQLKEQADRLRLEAQDNHSTSESYRQSVIDMEERLQEQRNREQRAERARLDLEARMAEVNKRKSKFACF